MDFTLNREQQDIVREARRFARGEFADRALEFDRNETFDPKIWKKACGLGFVGIFIDEEYGGAGMGYLDNALVTEEFWRADPGMGTMLLTTLGSEIILLHGRKEQKEKYLPPLCTGDAIMGLGCTEPDAGSDLTSVSTTAIKKNGEYVINGSKIFITNGTIADYLAPLPKSAAQIDVADIDGDGKAEIYLIEAERVSVLKFIPNVGLSSPERVIRHRSIFSIPFFNGIIVEPFIFDINSHQIFSYNNI